MLDAVALAVLGVPATIRWGVLAFVTNYIPNVGFLIGVAPPALIVLLDGGWHSLLWVICVYGVLNFVVQSRRVRCPAGGAAAPITRITAKRVR